MEAVGYAHHMIPADWKASGTVKSKYSQLEILLGKKGLKISPEKVQTKEPYLYLGYKLLNTFSMPQIILFKLSSHPTLVELQKWLGNINWIRPSIGLTTLQLAPLFDALKGLKNPGDKVQLSQDQIKVVELVQQTVGIQWVDRCIDNQHLNVILFQDRLPTAAIFQYFNKKVFILEWLHLAHTPGKSISGRGILLAKIIFKARQRCKILAGIEPSVFYLPFSLQTWEMLLVENEILQGVLGDWVGQFSCHPPADYRFQLINNVPLEICSIMAKTPIFEAVTVFTDGGKTYGACVWNTPKGWSTKITPPQTSAQRAELAAVILAFQQFSNQPFNLVVDSLYVYHIFAHLAWSYLSPSLDSILLSLFLTLQQLLESRHHSFYVAHIRSHQPLPGFLSEGNQRADIATKQKFFTWILLLHGLAMNIFIRMLKLYKSNLDLPNKKLKLLFSNVPPVPHKALPYLWELIPGVQKLI